MIFGVRADWHLSFLGLWSAAITAINTMLVLKFCAGVKIQEKEWMDLAAKNPIGLCVHNASTSRRWCVYEVIRRRHRIVQM